ncbi:hypothetical protein EIP91_000084 [Steccherinum ochraceum]|uniref:FAD/NAD(P)-binding domain-containing protein n=1 Tax=Steccherinum ochraceum TaxID=92696 RepID=A0A4R0RX63_9APHY|nr:hypothetical protein EIP91_000084 [Steccherinum ochraceum]
MAEPTDAMSPRLVKAAANSVKTVAVLGAAYGGKTAVTHLAENLPKGWRVVAVDRNTDFNHVYVFPRLGVLPGHSHKGFIPYNKLFASFEDSRRHLMLNAHVTKLGPTSLTLSKAFPEHGIDGDEPTLHFDYAIYALGSHMPAPINLWGPPIDEEAAPATVPEPVAPPKTPGLESVQPWGGPALSEVTTAVSPVEDEVPYTSDVGTKPAGVEWLDRSQKHIERAPSVLVVGGGALGIQYATDIAEIYPDKAVTLLHSRPRLLPRFDESMHDEIMSAMSSLNVNTILGDRLDLSGPPKSERNKDGILEHIVRTVSGREIRASVVLLCTGQRPNTELVRPFLPESIVPHGPSKGMIRVKRSLQIGVPLEPSADTLANGLTKLSVTSQSEDSEDDIEPELDVPYPHWFAVGDAADTFGAINAGHTAYAQALVAANNVLKLVHAEESSSLSPVELEEYHPGAPGIKMSIGRNKLLYQIGDQIGKTEECPDDLQAPFMWNFMLGRDVPEEEMYE